MARFKRALLLTYALLLRIFKHASKHTFYFSRYFGIDQEVRVGYG